MEDRRKSSHAMVAAGGLEGKIGRNWIGLPFLKDATFAQLKPLPGDRQCRISKEYPLSKTE